MNSINSYPSYLKFIMKKFLNYDLSDWNIFYFSILRRITHKNPMKCDYVGISSNIELGYNSSSRIYRFSVYCECSFKFCDLSINLLKYYKLYNYPEIYKHYQLEEAKNNINSYLSRIDKLKVFI